MGNEGDARAVTGPLPWVSRRVPLPVVLFLVVLTAAATFLFTNRSDRPLDTSADVGFLRDMSAHHAQAVMAAGFPQRMQKDYRDAIDALFDASRFRQKNGLGFWRYKEDSKGKPKKEEDAAVDGLLADVSQPKRDFTDDEIIARMMIPMINEVVRCLEEGIIASPAEADMALVYGLGFPPFHGGAFRWLDTLGSARYLDMAQQYQHLGPLYEVPEGLRNKARHNEPYYPAVEPARPVGELKTA